MSVPNSWEGGLALGTWTRRSPCGFTLTKANGLSNRAGKKGHIEAPFLETWILCLGLGLADTGTESGTGPGPCALEPVPPCTHCVMLEVEVENTISRHQQTIISPSRGEDTLATGRHMLHLGTSWSGVMCYDSQAK